MNPVSLVVARYLAVRGKPSIVVLDGKPDLSGVPTTDAIVAFCHSEFRQVPARALAQRVREALLALAKEAA